MSSPREEEEEQQQQHQQQEENVCPDLVPGTLLAFSKDYRYISTCQELLAQVLRGSNNDSTSLWWKSALLYATIVCVARRGNTLGMEFVGLRHAPTTTSQWQTRGVKFLLAAGWALWIQECILFTQNQEYTEQHERLRGAARQYFYQQQRRAMMQRATQNGATSAGNEETTSSSGLMEKTKHLVNHLVQSLSQAISILHDNPHALPDTSALISLGRWIVRLHVAHYCITGRYPTLFHSIFRTKVERSCPKSRLADPPPTTHVVVGKLIMIQAAATLVQTLSRWLATVIVSRIHGTLESESNDAVNGENATATSSQELCAICRTPRKHSAAPSACGHVFCWKCLQHWVSTVRPECPLCRAVCQPQDILALHNYKL